MTITLLSDQDTGFENKARVRKLPLQVFTAPDAQKLETEKQNEKVSSTPQLPCPLIHEGIYGFSFCCNPFIIIL